MTAARRTILRRGFLLLGGATGAGLAGRRLAATATDETPKNRPVETLELWGRHWSVTSGRLLPGELPGQGDRMLTHGVLLDGPDGAEVGEFYGTVFGLHAPGHEGPRGVASLEQHIFNLDGGSIMGTGTGTRDLSETDEFAIVGGLGRYAGLSGSYVARQRHWEFGGDGTAQFTLTILGH